MAVAVARKTATAVAVIFARRLNIPRHFATFAWLLQQPSPDHPLPAILSPVDL